MNAERWQQLDRLFLDALDRSPEERAVLLRAETSNDPALHADVTSLLASADATDGFMAASAFEQLAREIGTEGWTLATGDRVGVYVVRNLLGRGGASEVWRARDERLGRDVAIKVLLPHLSEDPARLRRFADEARAVGSLSHQNILAVYDVGDRAGMPFLVTECLEGRSLRGRLAAGLPNVAEAVTIAGAVARGLAAAHARGIVHCDLKPENVFLCRDGTVKILDFGIARLQHEIHAPAAAVEQRPTGVMAGTAGYMAPEQVLDVGTDARADLFALGVMLHEMLAGAAPFKRTSTLETLQAVLADQPPDLMQSAHPPPEMLARIAARLLRKEPEARFQSALDVAWAIEQASGRLAVPSAPAPSTASLPAKRLRLGFGLAAAAGIGAALALAPWRGPGASPSDAKVVRLHWALPPGVGLASAPAVSFDGQRVAYVAESSKGRRLFIRALSDEQPLTIEGSAGARHPFWSPDGRWVGYFAGARVFKVSVTGGLPVLVADDRRPTGAPRTERGGAWNRGGVILYGASFNPASLFSVPAAGGRSTTATTLSADLAQNSHRFPVFLPDGQSFIYQARSSLTSGRGVFLGTLGAPAAPPVKILQVDSNVVFTPGASPARGLLVYVANGRVEAQGFDPARRSLVGDPQVLPIEAGNPTLFHPAVIGASADVLAYARQLASGQEIKVLHPGGTPELRMSRQDQQWPRLSPDGTRVAWLRIDPVEPNADIWVEDLARRTRTRITTAPHRDLSHVWSPDGRYLAYRPDVDDRQRLTIVAADGSGSSRDLVCPRSYCEPTDWSSDGLELIVNVYEAEGTDVWALSVAPGGSSRPLLETRFNERDARLSPDRRWLAYVSEEGGRPEVSVRSLVGPARRYVVSPGGGDQVVWRRDGRALYYVDAGGRLKTVSVRGEGGALRAAAPIDLRLAIGSGHANTQYDVAPDGSIYYLDPSTIPPPDEIHLVLGWQRLLR